MVWLPIFGIVNMHTEADTCDSTKGMYGNCKSLHWKLTLGEKLLAAPGLEPASVLRLDFQSEAPPPELSPIPHSYSF